MREAIQTRVAANALELAKNGVPKAPFYLTGNVAGQPFTVHAEGETVILQKGDQRSAIALDPRPDPVLPSPSSVAPAQQTPVQPVPSPPPVMLPTPVAPPGIPNSPWTGAVTQPAAASALDRWQQLLDAAIASEVLP